MLLGIIWGCIGGDTMIAVWAMDRENSAILVKGGSAQRINDGAPTITGMTREEKVAFIATLCMPEEEKGTYVEGMWERYRQYGQRAWTEQEYLTML